VRAAKRKGWVSLRSSQPTILRTKLSNGSVAPRLEDPRCEHSPGPSSRSRSCQASRRHPPRLTIRTTRSACKSTKGVAATLPAVLLRWLNARRRHRAGPPNALSIHIMHRHEAGDATSARGGARRPNQADSAFRKLPGLSSPCAKNISLSYFRKSWFNSPRSVPTQGAYASSRTWSGMRWTRAVPGDVRYGRGRRSRVVLARPCRRQVLADAPKAREDDGGNAWFTGENSYKS
jgi:hypothetical protein